MHFCISSKLHLLILVLSCIIRLHQTTRNQAYQLCHEYVWCILYVPVVSVTVTCVLCVSIKQRVLWYESVQFFNGDRDVTYQQCQIFKSATNTRDFCIIQLQCIRVFNLSNAYTIERTSMCVSAMCSCMLFDVFNV